MKTKVIAFEHVFRYYWCEIINSIFSWTSEFKITKILLRKILQNGNQVILNGIRMTLKFARFTRSAILLVANF